MRVMLMPVGSSKAGILEAAIPARWPGGALVRKLVGEVQRCLERFPEAPGHRVLSGRARRRSQLG